MRFMTCEFGFVGYNDSGDSAGAGVYVSNILL